MKKRKVCVIGHFGGDKVFLDGQTVKTKNFYYSLLDNSSWEINFIDTFQKKKNVFSFFYKLRKAFKKADDVFVMPSTNGLSVILRLFSKMAKRNNTRIHHVVIGGVLPSILEKNKKLLLLEKCVSSIWVETNSMKEKMSSLGLEDVFVMPNFKLNEPLSHQKNYFKNEYSYCIFSRITESKGITDAIESFSRIKKIGYDIKLDIYGPLDKEYSARFKELVEENKSVVKYKGILSQDNITSVLCNYYSLVFPSKWIGEGFAGTILDAYLSGIPVIATDWNCNSEIVDNYKTGLLYPSKSITNLDQAILFSINNKKMFIEMRKNCILKSKEYDPKNLINNLVLYIEKNYPISS